MNSERLQVPSGQLLNERSRYLNELRLLGFHMTEAKMPSNPFNAIVYQQENLIENDHQQMNNLIFIPGVSGESGGTSHISASFLSELKPKIDTVIGYNAAISKTSLEAKKYDHNLDHQSNQIVELYEQAIPKDKRDQPLVIVGHSMGGSTAPIVARRLLERGFTINKLVLIAPPGLTERSDIKMLRDFLTLSSRKRIYDDIAILYPSPADIAGFIPRLEELSKKEKLAPQEKEEFATYQLAIQRQTEPDKLILTNINQRTRSRIRKIDEEMQYLLDPTRVKGEARIDKLQRRRRKMLLKPIRKVIAGKIYNEQLQKKAKSMQALRRAGNRLRSTGELVRTVSDMASEITLQSIRELIDYHNDSRPEQTLDIAVIAGSRDTIVGSYTVGDVSKKVAGENVTLTEIGLTNFDHYSLPDDPVRVAQVIDRLMEDKSKIQESAMV